VVAICDYLTFLFRRKPEHKIFGETLFIPASYAKLKQGLTFIAGTSCPMAVD
jgi:hypothetical protein